MLSKCCGNVAWDGWKSQKVAAACRKARRVSEGTHGSFFPQGCLPPTNVKYHLWYSGPGTKDFQPSQFTWAWGLFYNPPSAQQPFNPQTLLGGKDQKLGRKWAEQDHPRCQCRKAPRDWLLHCWMIYCIIVQHHYIIVLTELLAELSNRNPYDRAAQKQWSIFVIWEQSVVSRLSYPPSEHLTKAQVTKVKPVFIAAVGSRVLY